jgi:hypothetical protein
MPSLPDTGSFLSAFFSPRRFEEAPLGMQDPGFLGAGRALALGVGRAFIQRIGSYADLFKACCSS